MSTLVRKYETTIIFHPDAPEDDLGKVWERVDSILERHGAQKVRTEHWGKRRLAYTIKKVKKGDYHFFSFLGKGDVVAELESNLRILDPVIRFLTVRDRDEVELETFDFEAEKEALSPIARSGPDDGEYMFGGAGSSRPPRSRSHGDSGRDDDDDDDDDDEED
jgi:small subunit ribosomal protein S6